MPDSLHESSEPAEALERSPASGGAVACVRLNLGAGGLAVPGFLGLDRKTGDTIYPLAVPDGSVDEIRASHVLEHFAHGEVAAVLADWVRALKPGGLLKIAVPDFQTIAEAYLRGEKWPIQGYVMGGQVDADDFHKALFDREELHALLRAAGLRAIRNWRSEIQDCAALPVSLNLMGNKLAGPKPRIKAVMSMPRLCFTDNFFSAFEALRPNGIKLSKVTGAYWGQCLTAGIEKALSDGIDAVLTIDYDAIYTAEHVRTLAELMAACPEIDALAPLQTARHHTGPLWCMVDESGKPRTRIEMSELRQDVMPALTAHFGLTLIRASALARLPKPWFHATPDKEGGWGDGRIDADIGFWHRWRDCGNTLFIANRVAVGHAELVIRWPNKDLEAALQYPSDFGEHGPPKECWE